MDALAFIVKKIEKVFASAPELAFQISLIYSVLIFAFLVAALIKRSKTSLVWAILLAAGITSSYTAIKFIKPHSQPHPAPVKKIIKVKVTGNSADDAIMKITEKLFDRALHLKEYGFAKLPLYQKEIISNRLIPAMSLSTKETDRGIEAYAQISEDSLYSVLASLGYIREGKSVQIDIVNSDEVNLMPEEVSAIIEGIKRTSVFFLDGKLFTDISHLRQELVGMKLGRGISISDVRGTSTNIDIYLSRRR